MTATEPALGRTTFRALPRLRLTQAGMEQRLPVGIAIAVGIGLIAVVMTTPIAGRGDYGQWLMASRYYLGQPIPEYRDVTALPPFVPLLLALIRLAVPDPIIALQILNGLILAGLLTTFYLLGATLLSNRWAGVLSLAIGFLITDRFLELFAFGGLLQAAALSFMGLTVVAFVRAARAPTIERRWWLAGIAALGLASLSHVATGMIAIPVGLFAAGLAVIPHRNLGWRRLTVAFLPLGIGLAVVAGYSLLVLLPATGDYVTNPASLAYRGPGRLLSSLVSYGPGSVVIVVGIAAILVGSAGDLLRRRADSYLVLLVWLAVVWGALAYSMASGAATDYPRFATVLLGPIVVGAAGAVIWVIGALTRSARDMLPTVPQKTVLVVAVVLITATAAPFAVQRFGRQTVVYQPRDAQALTAAALAIDEELAGAPGTVLTDVRDGKWVEGLTGREALFSLPVRYAFRPIEWQRSVDADALLRSTTTLTSGLVSAMYIGRRVVDGETVPSDLLIRVNHGGEFADMLRINPAAVEVATGRRQWTALSGLAPVRASGGTNARMATMATVWQQASPRVVFTQRATVWKDGAAMGVRMFSPKHGLRATLSPPAGSAWTVSSVSPTEATVCLSAIGGVPPCASVWVGHPQASLSVTPGGELQVATRGSGQIQLLITALTAARASVGLGLLEPNEVLDDHDVRAALLWRFDPSFDDRVRRLTQVGFRVTEAVGPYQILLRTDLR